MQILERIEPNKMFLRIGMFKAEKVGKEKLEVACALSGGTLIIEVVDPRWTKKNKGEISPYRYKLTPTKITELALEEFEKQRKELNKK